MSSNYIGGGYFNGDWDSPPSWTIYGSDGKDVIDGGSGADTIQTLLGDDHIDGNGGSDRIESGDGNDVVNVTISDLTVDLLIDDGVSDASNISTLLFILNPSFSISL